MDLKEKVEAQNSWWVVPIVPIVIFAMIVIGFLILLGDLVEQRKTTST